MKEFIESLNLDQIEILKSLVDNHYRSLKNMSEDHIRKELSCLTKEELSLLKKTYLKQQLNVRSNKEYDGIELRIVIITGLLS